MSDHLSDRICSRCLVILDARSTVRDETSHETCPTPTNPAILREWVETHMWGEGHRISVDQWPNCFDPVGTWHGDAVCWQHLIECREREWGKYDGPARRH